MKNNRVLLIGTVLSGSLVSALIPVSALLTLTPSEYGTFSVFYLLFAFGVSIQYSLITEAWLRTENSNEPTSTENFSSVSSTLSLGIFVISALIALSSNHFSLGLVVLSIACAGAVYRVIARYHSLAQSNTMQILISDVIAIVSFCGLYLCSFILNLNTSIWIGIAWATSSLASGLLLLKPSFKVWAIFPWVKSKWKIIKPLLFDSLLMDIGAIVTPLVLATMMPARNFGIYRGISNVGFPIRMLIDPLRAKIGQLKPHFFRSMPFNLSLWFISSLAGLSLGLLVLGLANQNWIENTTIGSLANYSFEIGLFSGTSVAGTVYYILARTHSRPILIVYGRIIQTVLVCSFPIIGYSIGQLSSAIMGFAWSGAISSVCWFLLSQISNERRQLFEKIS